MKPLPSLFEIEAKVRRAPKPKLHEKLSIQLRPDDVVIGLDLSLTSTGVAAVHPGGIWHATIEPKSSGLKRIQEIRAQVLDVCKDRPLIVVEGLSNNSNGSYHSEMCGAWFSVVLALVEADRLVVAVNPMTLKKYLAGSGAAKKEQMIHHVWRKYAVECRTSDEADAVGLAMIGAMLGGLKKPTLAETESLYKARRVT